MDLALFVVTGLAVALAVGVGALARRIRQLEAERDTVDVVSRRTRAPGSRDVDAIVVEITNHAQVATSRTLLAKPLAAVTPGLIRSIVNRETLRIMREQLLDQGVAADVRIRRLRMPVADTRARVVDGEPVGEVDEPDELDDWLHNDGENPYDSD